MPTALDPRVPPKPPRFPFPRRKEEPPRPRPDSCLNCGRATGGNFCAFCGQENKDHTVALRPLLADLLAEVASWDSKLLRTLAALVRRPGFLTNEYNAGRRVGFLSPFKLYLSASVLFFLLLSWKNPLTVHAPAGGPAPTHGTLTVGRRTQPLPRSEAEYGEYQRRLAPARRDPALARTFIRQSLRARQSPALFLSALVNDIPKMMFFLLPLFAGTLKLLYLRTKRLYVEHLVFLLHVHAFAFLALALLLPAHPAALVWAVGLALPGYVVRAMRVVYAQGWPETLLKFTLLALSYFLLLLLCFAGTAVAALWLL